MLNSPEAHALAIYPGIGLVMLTMMHRYGQLSAQANDIRAFALRRRTAIAIALMSLAGILLALLTSC